MIIFDEASDVPKTALEVTERARRWECDMVSRLRPWHPWNLCDYLMEGGMTFSFKSGDEVTLTAAGGPHYYRIGDRIIDGEHPNRLRWRVSQIISKYEAAVAVFIRPSRGYAKHVRRRKAAENKGKPQA